MATTWCSPSGSCVTSTPCHTRSHCHRALSCVAHYVTLRLLTHLMKERGDPGAIRLALLGDGHAGHRGDLLGREMRTVGKAHEARQALGAGIASGARTTAAPKPPGIGTATA